MKPSRQPAFSRLAATLAAVVLGLGMPAFSSVAAATPSNYTASVIDGAIPATLDGITLTQAPSFGGADNGVEESRSAVRRTWGRLLSIMLATSTEVLAVRISVSLDAKDSTRRLR